MLAEPHDLDDTARRADGVPVVADVVKSDEDIAGEQRLTRIEFATVSPLLEGECGQIAEKFLSLEVLECSKFLATLALDDIPPMLAHAIPIVHSSSCWDHQLGRW